jgi:hypothetical protein
MERIYQRVAGIDLSRDFLDVHARTIDETTGEIKRQKVSKSQLGLDQTALSQPVVSNGRRNRALQSCECESHSLPISRSKDSVTVGSRRKRMTIDMNPWRAGCGESRTPGSEDGSWKHAD